jgi:hypothetical protein
MKKKILAGIALVILAVVMIFSTLSQSPEPEPTTAPPAGPAPVSSPVQAPRTTKVIPMPGDKGTIGASGSYPVLPIEDLITMSDAIVIGEVTDILPAKKAKNPAPAPPEIIYQDVIFRVERYLSRGSAEELIAIRVLGGKIGNEYFLARDVDPEFTVGEKALLFLYVPPAETVFLGAVPERINPGAIYKVTTSIPGKFVLEGSTAIDYKGQRTELSVLEEKITAVLQN